MRNLTKSPSDFRNPSNGTDALYDSEFDAVLIEQSIATQYGILPGAQGELRYPEWSKLVSGLMDNTPLGRVVAVRGEMDPKIVAQMNPAQKRIRAEWRSFLASRATMQPREDLAAQMAALERMMASAFGGG